MGKIVTICLDKTRFADAIILKVFEPFTLSCVLLVQLCDDQLSGQFVLKLYDRRFAAQLRKDRRLPLWTAQLESRYREFVRKGHASQFFDICAAEYRKDAYWASSRYNDWSEEKIEAFCQYFCYRSYNIEREAYKTLKSLQGKHVPRLYAELYTQFESMQDLGVQDNRQVCPGLLLQHISGFPLTDLEFNAPERYWQQICDEAISVVHQIGDLGVCNEDVHTRSVIVCPNKKKSKFEIFMIDFGKVCFLKDAENLEEFRSSQAHEDEEGAIGRIMAKKLKGGYKYDLSPRALKLLDDFMSEE